MDASQVTESDDDFAVVEHDMVPAARTGSDLQRKIDELLHWLQPTDYLSPGNEYMKHLNAYVPGTGKWAHESTVFRSWRGEDMSGDPGTDTESGYHNIHSAAAHGTSCLYIRGVAGSGKSVFAGNTIDQLRTAGNIVLFFFFRQIVERNHAAKYLVRDFAAQLLPHSQALVIKLSEISEENSVGDTGIDVLWSAIFKVITEGGVNKEVFCVVDALDEMDDADFPDMMEKLLALGASNPQAVKTLFTGRPLPKIEQAIQNRGVVQLKLDPVLLHPDVARYVDARMASLNPKLSDERNELVKKAICERASGLFLHARLVTDNLAQSLQEGSVTEETLPDSLDRLPRSLREVYEEMLKEHARRSGVSTDQQAKLLTCVTHSSRPMRLIELGSLVAQMLRVDLRRGKELVRASCGRLLEMLEDETVSVIHHSFTEFLHDHSRRDVPQSFPVLDDFQSHDMLAALCLEYLDGCPHFDITTDETRLGEYCSWGRCTSEQARREKVHMQLRLSHPLAEYAINNIAFHFQKSGNKHEGAGIAALDSYFLPGHAAFETWALVKWDRRFTLALNALHLLIGIEPDREEETPLFVIQHLAQSQPCLVDAPDPDWNTPLNLAAQCGRHDIVELLLSMGANLESVAYNGATPLHSAVSGGHTRVVQLLLEAGVDPLIKQTPSDEFKENNSVYGEEYEMTALSMAMSGTSLEVTLQFIPFITADQANDFFHTARTAETIDAILRTGLVDVNSFSKEHYRNAYEGTKIVAAAASGDVDMVKLLLRHGADPAKRKPGQPSALHAAAGIAYNSYTWFNKDKEEAIELVRLLTDAGADVNAPMNGTYINRDHKTNYTPLHAAVRMRAYSIMDMGTHDKSEECMTKALLVCGADANATTSLGDTPLYRVNPERPQLLRLLVEYGADIDRKNGAGRTPLLNTIRRLGHQEGGDKAHHDRVAPFLHELLNLGADPTDTDSAGNGVFHYLMHSIASTANPHYTTVVERLLQGADVNWQNEKGEVALFWYKRCRQHFRGYGIQATDDKLLVQLVQGGMRLDIRDNNGDTFLHGLIRNIDLKIEDVKKLIRLGADPNAPGSGKASLLQTAIRQRVSLRWVKFLAKLNTLPFCMDENGNSIIHEILAPSYRSGAAVTVAIQLVVSAGADPLAKNHRGETALHVVPSHNAKHAAMSPYFETLINEMDSDGFTPLHCLAKYGGDVCAELLQRGADPFLRSKSGMLPLHCAAQAGESDSVMLLLAQYREPSVLSRDVNSFGGGLSPLHYACRAGSAATASVLLRFGANPTLPDESSLTPLHMLASFVPIKNRFGSPNTIRTPELVRMLCKQGVDINAMAIRKTDDTSLPLEATALDLATESKRWEVVRELLACGANVPGHYRQSREFIMATDKDLALESVRKMKLEMDSKISCLSEAEKRQLGGRCSRWAAICPPSGYIKSWTLGPETIFEAVNSTDYSGSKFNILQELLENHDFDTIYEYYDQGGDILAIEGPHVGFLQYLVEEGYEHFLSHFSKEAGQFKRLTSQRWEKDKQYPSTLLGVACLNHHPSMNIVEWLVEEIKVGVDDPHACDLKMTTEAPLHILSRGNSFWHLEAMEFLLSNGANIEVRAHDGLTPLMTAFDKARLLGRWNLEAARLLLKHGANVNAGREEDWDETSKARGGRKVFPLDVACDAAGFQLLIAAGADVTLCPGLLTRSIRNNMLPDAAEVLLDSGVDPNEKPRSIDDHRKQPEDREYENRWGAHALSNNLFALHEAARPTTHRHLPRKWNERRLAMTELLLSHGADPYSTYPDGSFVLQRIVEERGLALRCLLRRPTARINMRGSHGRTLLIQACVPGVPHGPEPYSHEEDTRIRKVAPELVSKLLELGADVNVRDEMGRTALHWFCTQTTVFDQACQEAFKSLVAADPSSIQARDESGRLPLHLALEAFSCKETSLDFAIRHLVASGADSSIPDPTSGDTTLHYMARSLIGDSRAAVSQAMALFKEFAAIMDINSQNNEGYSVVAAAIASPFPETSRSYSSGYARRVKSSYRKAVKFLINLGARVDTIDAKGQNLLHVAVGRQIDNERYNVFTAEVGMIEELFVLLLDQGLDPRKEDNNLRTAIDIAVAREMSSVVNLFTEEGKRMAEERKLKQNGCDSDTEDEEDIGQPARKTEDDEEDDNPDEEDYEEKKYRGYESV